ncbi:hypothetical protein SAFG77S_13487 [Streptomyces afghaniensis]
MEKLRIGMVGYKFMGKAHSHAYRDLPLFFPNTVHPEMKVICGRDQNGVTVAAKQFGWEEYTTDWKSLLERDDIDLIDINALVMYIKKLLLPLLRPASILKNR